MRSIRRTWDAVGRYFKQQPKAALWLQHSVVAAVALCLVAYGLWLIYPPLAPLVVGLLLWVDLSVGGLRK